MLQNFIKMAFRHMIRSKGFSAINILGLAVGIACCVLILMYVRNELSFDKYLGNSESIQRLALDRKYPERVRSYVVTPYSFAGAMKETFPEIKEVVRIFNFNGPGNAPMLLNIDEQVFEEENAMFVDTSFFNVFDFHLVRGEPSEVLVQPNSAVLTVATARRLFGDADPIGKTIKVPNGQIDLVVTGISEDVPVNSHFTYNILLSTNAPNFNFLQQPNFVNFACYTYLLMEEGASPASVEAGMDDFVTKHASGDILRMSGLSYSEYLAAGHGYRYFLQPLEDIYLHSNLEGELSPPGSMTRIYIFTTIAFFILLIAIINFMNLSTAQATERAKEVGIRKTLGSVRGQLISQFMVEALLISVISTLLAIGVLYFLVPVFNDVSGKTFTLWQVVNWGSIPLFMMFAVLIGLLSGSYPAFVLSGFDPISVLKGKLISTKHGAWMRNGLVVFQFAISVVLIISTIVVYSQLQFIRNKELGFNKEQLLTLQRAGGLQTKTEAFKDELLKLPQVTSVGACNVMPGGTYAGLSFRKAGSNEPLVGNGVFVDEDFVESMEMELVAGRDFDERFADSAVVVLNETAVRELGLTDPVGKRLSTNDFNLAQGGGTAYYEVIGVVKDYHFQSLHQTIAPVYIFLNNNPNGANNLLTVRVRPGDAETSIAAIEGLWKQFMPDQPFSFTFLDNELQQLYIAEQVAQKIFGLFSVLAIFIACIGLLGLAAYLTQQRTKEIGIRKILGASIGNIIGLLSKDFLKLVLIALVIGIPLAWYAMDQWLTNFAYSIKLSWWIFAIAGLLAVSIAFLTVSYQSLRAAIANPIKSLRDE